MSTLSEGELHVQAMRLVCEALADREQNGIEVDWNVLRQMHDQMAAMLQDLWHKHRYDSSEMVDLRKDRDAARAEIATLRKELANAQRELSEQSMVANVETQQDAAAWQQQVDSANAEVSYLRARLDEERSVIAGLREQLDAARAEIETLKGAMAADDQRLRDAEERIWPERTLGCDAPDAMADEILHLRHLRNVAEGEAVVVRKWMNDETDRYNKTNAEKVALFQKLELANKHCSELVKERDAAQAAVTLQRAGIERLQAFVGKVRAARDEHNGLDRDARVEAALAELDAGTEPAPVAEPIDAEGGQ